MRLHRSTLIDPRPEKRVGAKILCLSDLSLARPARDPLRLDNITAIAGHASCLAEVLSRA